MMAEQSIAETAAAAPPTETTAVEPTATEELVASPTNTAIPTNAFVASPTPTLGALATSTLPSFLPSPTLPSIFPTNTPVKNNNANCYKAQFVSESAPYDGDLVLTTHRFTKRWTIKNIGSCSWGPEVQLHWIAATKDGKQIINTFSADAVQTPIYGSVEPLEKLDIEVVFKTPDKTGVYQLFWRLTGPNGAIKIDGSGDLWLLVEVYNP